MQPKRMRQANRLNDDLDMKRNLNPCLTSLLLATAAILIFGPTQPAGAAGLLVADGGFGGVLQIKEHEVHVTLNNGIAVTKVTQVFHNTERRQVEALYTFPVPRGASVANFSMWINGKEMTGEVLEKERAREIYNSYKQSRRDPGLLEQTDFRTFEMRIFPIGPDADQKVELTYYQELDFDHDWGTYIYPLATATRKEVDSRTTSKFSFALDMKSAVPLATLESPSHGDAFVIAKHSDLYWQASLETPGGSLAKDVVLACQISRPRTGLDLITSKRDGEDGYFCLTLTAGDDLTKADEGMDYVFVLDVSGSMAVDGKLLLSKDSIDAFIGQLGEKDRFEVMAFNAQPYLAFNQLRPAVTAAKQEAGTFLATQQARGGTVLNPALTTAYKYADADRPLNVVVLSDGMTEVQERQTLLQLIRQRPRSAKVFCIGVGNDVNKPLLEQLAQDAGGLAAFLSPEDNFTRQAQAFRRKLTRPAATDLHIDFGPSRSTTSNQKSCLTFTMDHPSACMAVTKAAVRASGPAGQHQWRRVEAGRLAGISEARSGHPEIDRMWAWHRIDNLLKEADRNGSRNNILPEVIKLARAIPS
jgi:Ca-activated chloride channel family protein